MYAQLFSISTFIFVLPPRFPPKFWLVAFSKHALEGSKRVEFTKMAKNSPCTRYYHQTYCEQQLHRLSHCSNSWILLRHLGRSLK